MAEEQTGQERTEQPTERRLQEARRRGQVPRSRELNTMLSLLAACAGLWALGGGIVQRLAAIGTAGLQFDRALALDSDAIAVFFMHLLIESVVAILPFLAVTAVAAMAGPMIMGGWVFSPEAIAFKWEKLDPIKGLGRLFSAKGLAELLKTLVKFALLVAATWLLVRFFERDLLVLSAYTPNMASQRVLSILLTSLLALCAVMVVIVLFDVPFEMWNFSRQLRMTRQEVKDELKESEGRPEVRQRIRTLQREAARRRMMQDVAKADVVITNPTHYAVAIVYEEHRGAPRVVAKGRDLLAQQIRLTAQLHEVPVFEAPPLARALYASTEIGAEIPRALYLAVARVLAYLYQLRRLRPTDYVPRPDIEVPDEFRDLTGGVEDDGND